MCKVIGYFGSVESNVLYLAVSIDHEPNGFKVSVELCLNLCTLKWLKPKHNLLSNLTLSGP